MVSALNSIDTLLAHPRKRDGAAMSKVGDAMALDVALLQGRGLSMTTLGLHAADAGRQ